MTREPSEELGGLPKLAVEGLRDGEARALLGSAVRVPLDERVRERLVGETRGSARVLYRQRAPTSDYELYGSGLRIA